MEIMGRLQELAEMSERSSFPRTEKQGIHDTRILAIAMGWIAAPEAI